MTDHTPQPLEYQEGLEALTKNLVGRLNSAAVVKTAVNTALNSTRRAAGIEVPFERPPSKKILSKQKDSISQISKQISSSVSQSQKSPLPKPLILKTNDVTSNSCIDNSEDEDEVPQSEAQLINHIPPPSLSPSPDPPKQPTFLPSLYSGYISASDSSDPDDEISSFGPLQKVRKNRKGQRERQGIWLKKYGKDARHLHPELQPEKPKEEGTGTRIESKEGPKEIHPSWLAKQKLREQQKLIINSHQAKKIVFE